MRKKVSVLLAMLLIIGLFSIAIQDNNTASAEKKDSSKLIRAEVDEIVNEEFVKLIDVNGNYYTAPNHDYKKLDVLLIQVSDNGIVLSQEKRNTEIVNVTDVSKNGQWLIGYNERGEQYAIDKRCANLGEKIKLNVNMFGDIYSSKKIN
ncbi:hypothetical protein P8891_05680 [Bacillus atrophaeus]|uniref:hypothetical protein n=1 Tax=Bacillus atrophaeus TaxID=1452 RepID=UPI002282898A|nr:hypothetical protein [Bacillus atrophaeus]MCY7947953.1 hypothetical protein [Bacillus atrophaeus]MCY8098248.1 hypothetical protein [Bacillus atrophaeus]MCY9170025.1 hypothetical protein [Bacillus atrophaeus]MEC0740578.1 hypothetical protein [Bacillus atrophaeus]MEC0746986.1 hypothetical protein [Bacillus atrophaeus]